MRQVISMLIALLAIAVVIPAMSTPAALSNQSETTLAATPSMVDFLSDSWTPSSYSAPLVEPSTPDIKGKSTTQDVNKTKALTLPTYNYAILDFLNDNWQPSSYTAPVVEPATPDAKKISTTQNINKTKAQNLSSTGYAVLDFMNDNWTPSTQAVPVSSDLGYTKGKMG